MFPGSPVGAGPIRRTPMGDLLALAIVAHGGMQRWDEFKTSRPSFPSPAPSGASSSSRSAHRQDLRDRNRDDSGASFAGQTLETPWDQDGGVSRPVSSERANARWFHKKHYANAYFDVISIFCVPSPRHADGANRHDNHVFRYDGPRPVVSSRSYLATMSAPKLREVIASTGRRNAVSRSA